MKNSVKVLQKLKNKTAIWSSYSISDHLSKENEKKKKERKKPQKPLLRKDICTSGFTAALITTTKISEQPNFCGWINN